jgi:ATP-dependent helicase/DNAse subunit B
MLCAYIRSSSMVNYDFCQMQYFMTYVLGLKSDSGKKAELGTIVHKVMEVVSGLKKDQQDNPKRKFIENIDSVTGKTKIRVEELYTDDFLRRLEDTSFQEYVKDSRHHWTKGDRKQVTTLVNMVMDHANGEFDPRKRNVLEPEPHFDLVIDEPWAKYDFIDGQGKRLTGQLAIKGTIDLVTTVDADTIEVIDWKTGQRKDWVTGDVKDYAKLQNDPQLLLYYYAISRLYPQYKNVIMTIYFVKDGGPFTLFFDDSDKEKFLNILKNRYKEIIDNTNPQPISKDRTFWKCTRVCHFGKNDWDGAGCNMCQYVGDYLDKNGMDKTVTDLTAPGFEIGYYEAPG